MPGVTLNGTVSFVNHEKGYITIEYEQSGKKRSVNGTTGEVKQKKHHFHIGDSVSFNLQMAERGDRQVATEIKFLYNNALEVLINKANTENRFIGYLKIADDKYFVKEIDSYLFFPVSISPWQFKPTAKELNEAVAFSLENTEARERITAKLFNNTYIPEFYAAVKAHKANTPVEAEVYKITPHGIYLNVFGDKIRAKILPEKINTALKPGDKINIIISYLSPAKIVVQPV